MLWGNELFLMYTMATRPAFLTFYSKLENQFMNSYLEVISKNW